MFETNLSRFCSPAILAAGALVASLSVPASAQPDTAMASFASPSATTAPRGRAPDAGTSAAGGERQICVREEITGSRMRRRVCKTAREWEAAGVPNPER